jgi:hypothetical protein
MCSQNQIPTRWTARNITCKHQSSVFYRVMLPRGVAGVAGVAEQCARGCQQILPRTAVEEISKDIIYVFLEIVGDRYCQLVSLSPLSDLDPIPNRGVSRVTRIRVRTRSGGRDKRRRIDTKRTETSSILRRFVCRSAMSPRKGESLEIAHTLVQVKKGRDPLCLV